MNSNAKLYQTNTTFTKKPVAPQISSYIIFALQTCLFYSLVMYFLEDPLRIIMTSLYTFSLASLIVSSAICSRTDPSDKVMILYRNHPKKEFDEYRNANRDKQKYLFCDYCNSFVKQRSRHCRVCDRCTQNFDHHCMWINNCVGDLNYRSFFVMIVSAFTNLALYVATLSLVTYKVSFKQNVGPLTISWISGAVNSIFVILLINLIYLHIYLNWNGLSTFDFILAQRLLQQKNKQLAQNSIHPDTSKPNIQKSQKSRDQQVSNNGLVNNNIMQSQSLPHTQSIKIQNRQHRDKLDNPNRQSEQSGEDNERRSNKKKSIIFGENEVTQKSDSDNGNPKSIKPMINENQDEQSQQNSSMQISQLFTRNKSLKLIIGTNQFYVPHKVKKSEQIQIRQTSKSKSMYVHPKLLK